MKSQEFVTIVKKMAKENGFNVFVVTDGASGWSNNGNKVIKTLVDFFKTMKI